MTSFAGVGGTSPRASASACAAVELSVTCVRRRRRDDDIPPHAAALLRGALLTRDRLAQLTQLFLDRRGVLRAHADQKLLSGGPLFERRIGELVENAGLGEADWTRNFGRREQVIDHFDESIVEIAVRVAEICVRFLKERVETRVQSGEL